MGLLTLERNSIQPRLNPLIRLLYVEFIRASSQLEDFESIVADGEIWLERRRPLASQPVETSRQAVTRELSA